ncbi:CidA/LrgA family protein [Herbinix luporum]|uniref:CidA/LrgA family protein n=1 Tax=Herbinix luporum TaxID=1679721 RepID=UPI0023F27BFB|nr:CidA/LrgA family protein [Herbinix luporum]
MNYMKQFGIILLVSFLGEVLKHFLSLPIPASIYGLVIMLLALRFKIISLESVQGVGNFLINIMPMLFIPAGVGLLTSWNDLSPIFLPIILITIISTVMVMVVVGRITQFVIRMNKR